MDDLAAILAESPPDIGTDSPPDLWSEPRPMYEGPLLPGAGPIVQPQFVDDAFLARLMPPDPSASPLMAPPRPQRSAAAPSMPPLQLPRGANVGSMTVTERGYSPEENDTRYALQAEIDKLTGERNKTAEELGDVTSEGLAAKADIAHEKMIQAAVDNMEADEVADMAEADMAEAKSAQDEAHRHYRDFKFHNYWYTRSTGQKILALISVALGGFANRMLGRKNEALEILNGAEEQDFKQQAARLDQLKEAAIRAGADIEAVTKMDNLRRQSLKLKQAAANDAIAAKFEEAGLRSGSEAVRLQAQQAAQDRRMKALENRYEAYKPVERTIKMEAAKRFAPSSGGGAGGLVPLYDSEGRPVTDEAGRPMMAPKGAKYLPRPPAEEKATEAQNKLALMADDIKQALTAIESAPTMSQKSAKKLQQQEEAFLGVTKLSSQGAFGNMAARFQRWTGLAPSSKYEGLTEQEQLSAHAYDVAKDAYLRIISGAGITDPEEQRNAMSNKPQYGESPALVAQKLERLKRIAENALKLSGKAGAIVGGAKGAPKASASPGPGWVQGTYKGMPGWRDSKTGEFRPD